MSKLEAYFYRYPPELGLNINAVGLEYRVTGYATCGDYTLVSWTFGNQEEFIAGENLYHHHQLLEAAGGQAFLSPTVDPLNPLEPNPWQRINRTYQNLKIPPAIASSLRDPKNYRQL